VERALIAAIVTAGLAMESPVAVAQELPRFEVASVRPHRAADDLMFALQFHDGGRFTATATLRMLIRTAYRLQDFQVVAGEGWMDDERFDIDARPARSASPDEMRLMLRELLRERFGLALRQERRDVPVYALRASGAGAGLGARLKRPPVDCAARAVAAGAAPTDANGGLNACGLRLTPGGLNARGVTMAMLANELSTHVDRIVIDQTGLAGEFDVDLDWTPSQLQPPAFLEPPAPPIAVAPDWPSVFTSVREQLGLSLEPGRGQADVSVIARAQRPAAN
jgi:bla regulator protein blaR1